MHAVKPELFSLLKSLLNDRQMRFKFNPIKVEINLGDISNPKVTKTFLNPFSKSASISPTLSTRITSFESIIDEKTMLEPLSSKLYNGYTQVVFLPICFH